MPVGNHIHVFEFWFSSSPHSRMVRLWYETCWSDAVFLYFRHPRGIQEIYDWSLRHTKSKKATFLHLYILQPLTPSARITDLEPPRANSVISRHSLSSVLQCPALCHFLLFPRIVMSRRQVRRWSLADVPKYLLHFSGLDSEGCT
jgi:hypothetical protein